MRLRQTLQAVAVVAAAGSCARAPQEATLTVETVEMVEKDLAGLELDIGGAIPERLFTTADPVYAPFVVPDAGTATVAARLVQDGRTVAEGLVEWELKPERQWTLSVNRLGACPAHWCYREWRLPIVEDVARYEDEALWLYLIVPAWTGPVNR